MSQPPQASIRQVDDTLEVLDEKVATDLTQRDADDDQVVHNQDLGEVNHSPAEVSHDDAEMAALSEQLGLSPGQIESLRDAYLVFDRDGDGGISETELRAVVRSMGQKLSKDEVHRMFQEVDDDNSGEIDLNEFLQIMANNINRGGNKQGKRSSEQEEGREEEDGGGTQENWKVGFELFDADRDGLITCEDLGRVLRNMGEQIKSFELDEMFAEVARGGAKTINFEEFVDVMENGIPM
jgi:Ca2+-binding EF-hand superfamily protein